MSAAVAKPTLSAIKCTQCGGSIEIHGGHNVRSIVCQYCGSCLDTKDQFKVLHQFLNQKRPFMPLKIGARGKLKGVMFTVIGVLQMEEREDGEIYRWLEYLLFSPTHGYVYLVFEDGHWVMLHEVKDLPDSTVEMTMPRKSAFKVRDKTFKVFESSGASITYVEGELTWQARAKERVRYVDAVCPPFMYCIEMRGAEQEYFWGEYVPYTEINESFKISSFEPTGVFSCQPFSVSPLFESFSIGAVVAGVIALVMYFMISSNGSLVFSQKFNSKLFQEGDVSKEFKVADPDKLYGIRVYTPSLKNSWSYYDVRVVNKDETTKYFDMPTALSFYDGYEGGEYWSEGSTEVTAFFKIPETGEFKLAMDGEGGTGESPAPNFSLSNTTVEVREGVRQGHYTLSWFFLCLLIGAPYIFRKWTFETQRWSDGDDEDDD
jgi:DNA-directed RNA polymerase subunit RPC12/RpoP